jgi:hypothetical protein
MVNEEQPSSMRVRHLSVDSLRCRRRAVLHGQKHAPDELLQANGERRPRVTRRIRRQLASYEPNIFGEIQQVVLDEMLGDEAAGAGNASNVCWKRARVYPTSSMNHAPDPNPGKFFEPPTGRGLARPGAWAATTYPIGQHRKQSGWSVQTSHDLA